MSEAPEKPAATQLRAMATAYAVLLNVSIEQDWDVEKMREALCHMIINIGGDMSTKDPEIWLDFMQTLIQRMPHAHKVITDFAMGFVTPEENEKLKKMAEGMKLEDLINNKTDQKLRQMYRERKNNG